MARVTCVPDRATQLRLVAWMRWRLFVNGLRTLRGKADLATKIIFGSLTGLAVLACGPLLGIGSWYALSSRKPFLLSGELWLVFLIWLVFPLFISGFGAESDPASLLRFPLRYSAFVILALAHGLFDPVALAAMYWLMAVAVGIAVASPGALLWAVPALSGFAVFSLLLNRTIFAWLSHWMARRRTREILGALFILAMFGLQLTGPLAQRYGKRVRPILRPALYAAHLLPPGLTAAASSGGNPQRSLAPLAGLVVCCAVLAVQLSFRLRAQYRGENLNEARGKTADGPYAVRAGWNVLGLSPIVAALFEKDLRYVFRNSAMALTLLAPVLIVLMMTLNPAAGHSRRLFFLHSTSILFPVSIGYVMLTFAGYAFNSLGFDGPGLPILFAAPIRFRDVLLAKNLLLALLVMVEMLAVSVLVWFIAGPVPLAMIWVTLTGALWVFVTNLAAGNLTSLYFPQRLSFGQMRRQKASGMATAASLGIQVLLATLGTAAYFLSRWAGHVGWCGIAFLALTGAAGLAYRRGLQLASAIAWRRREALMAELSPVG